GLRERLSELLAAPVLPTAAGHDAGVLAAHVRAAMLFVRNPTGVSHAPGEWSTDEDCASGVDALADVLADLNGCNGPPAYGSNVLTGRILIYTLEVLIERWHR